MQDKNKTGHDKTRQDKTRQDKTRQDKTNQYKTRQDKTRQDKGGRREEQEYTCCTIIELREGSKTRLCNTLTLTLPHPHLYPHPHPHPYPYPHPHHALLPSPLSHPHPRPRPHSNSDDRYTLTCIDSHSVIERSIRTVQVAPSTQHTLFLFRVKPGIAPFPGVPNCGG
jgi:hypothetical protein